MRSAVTAKIFTILGAVFTGVGVVLLVVAAALTIHQTSRLSHDDRTEAHVVAVRTRSGHLVAEPGVATGGRPVYEYVVAGRTYRHVDSVDTTPVHHDVGESVTIAYDPDRPDRAMMPGPSAFFGAFVTGGLAVVFAGIGVPFLVLGLRRLRRFRELRDHGQETWGEVTSIALNASVRVNGRSPHRVSASWKDAAGVAHVATGESLDLPALKVGDRVRVYFDPGSPADGVVDVDGSLAAERASGARQRRPDAGDGRNAIQEL